jgi:hypothetical protein
VFFLSIMISSMAMTAILLSMFTVTVSGSAFLQAQVPASNQVTAAEVEMTLSELFSHVASSQKVRNIEQEMRPMYLALPKDRNGNLESATVRYAVHRYFVQKYGWYMKGLEGSGSQLDSLSSAMIMKERTPTYVQTLFSERLHVQGFGLREIAVFAGALSDLVHKEAWSGVYNIFSALSLPTQGPVPQPGIDMAMKAYLLHYLRETDMERTDAATVLALHEGMSDMYPGWGDTQLWANDFARTQKLEQASRKNPFVARTDTFDDVVAYAEEFGHKFGSYQRLECASLKDNLVDMEFEGTGRILLSRFYARGLKGDWSFTEPLNYLRNLGVVDDSDPKRPSVMIPNYVSSAANCLISSGFYGVCCPDECEGLLNHLERLWAEPAVAPERIVDSVSNLPSDTVDAPRNMSAHLIGRLTDIAKLHGGRVPLHSRLFAQWMHHVYPRECPFPHMSGIIKPMMPREWMEHTGNGTEASMEDMQVHFDRLEHDESHSLEMPWDSQEELVAENYSPAELSSWFSSVRSVMAFATLASFVVAMLRAFNTAASSVSKVEEKVFV